MRIVVFVARFLLGATFVFFGLNTVLWSVFDAPIVAPPEEMPAAAAAFNEALSATGFMQPLRGAVEFLSGLMILTGVFLPLGLVLLAPIVVHIVGYHIYIDRAGLEIAWVLVALGLFLAWAYAPSFRGLLTPKASSRWSGG